MGVLSAYIYIPRPEEAIGFPETGVSYGCETP